MWTQSTANIRLAIYLSAELLLLLVVVVLDCSA